MKSPKDSLDRVGKWAVYGIATGFQEGREGKSYAIKTIIKPGMRRSVPLREIEIQIIELLNFARENPQYEFLVTKIGSSLAGYTDVEIRSLFIDKDIPKNVSLPTQYQ